MSSEIVRHEFAVVGERQEEWRSHSVYENYILASFVLDDFLLTNWRAQTNIPSTNCKHKNIFLVEDRNIWKLFYSEYNMIYFIIGRL